MYADQVAGLASAVRAASRAHGSSPLRVLRHARRVRRDGGYEYDEALVMGLLDPGTTTDELGRHSSKHAALEAQRRVNPEALSALTEQKAIFYAYLQAVGLPAPRLLGVVGRGTGCSGDGRVIADLAAFSDWIGSLPDDFVMKPSGGYHGDGVRVIHREGATLRALSQGPVTPAHLYHAMGDPARDGLWVVQERARNASAPEFLGAPEALQTARIVTVVHPDGDISVVHRSLRIAVPGSFIDNYRGGTTGNCFAMIDEAGRMGPVWSRHPAGCGFAQTPDLPGTGLRVEGESLPDWDDAVALTRRGALHLLPARTIGWDVAFTPEGPTIVEANMWWDPPATPDQGAAVARLGAPTAA